MQRNVIKLQKTFDNKYFIRIMYKSINSLLIFFWKLFTNWWVESFRDYKKIAYKRRWEAAKQLPKKGEAVNNKNNITAEKDKAFVMRQQYGA